jgi:hypothetical protein
VTNGLLRPSKNSDTKAEKTLESPGLIELEGITLSEDAVASRFKDDSSLQ